MKWWLVNSIDSPLDLFVYLHAYRFLWII